MLQFRKKQSITRILNRTIFFLFTFSVILFAYYVLGNFNGLLDSSQRIILFFTAAASILLGLFALYGIIAAIIFLIVEKRFYYARLIPGYILSMAAAILLLSLSSGVLTLSAGVP